MNSDLFEKQMRRGEYFHDLRIPVGMWTIIRLDGRGFTKLLHNLGFNKPFDYNFHSYMVLTTEKLMKEFNGVFATTHSDEISLLLPPSTNLFDREIEKIISTTAGFASAHFSVALLGNPASFDSRIWIGATVEDVENYFSWRQHDAIRGSINSLAYWTLRQKEGQTKRLATNILLRKSFSWKNEMLFSTFGINFNEIPSWQKRGTGCHFILTEKEGYNPITKEPVQTLRRVLHTEKELPTGEVFREFLGINLENIIHVPELKGCFPLSSQALVTTKENEKK